MSSPFTQEQIARLSIRIDQQLQQLRDQPSVVSHKSGEPDSQEISERLPVQWQAIGAVTKEDPRSFWLRFRQAAQHDLCEEGGVLNTQWQKWRDLSSRSVLESFSAILAAMGFSGNALQVLAVALAVVVLHLGCSAICEEY